MTERRALEDPGSRGILALDRSSWEEAETLVEALGEEVGFYKVGLELFTAKGPRVVEELHRREKRIFLDLKLHDIPNTVSRAAWVAGRLRTDLLTVHAAGGAEMVHSAVQAAADASAGRTRILAVTMLTSLSEKNVPKAFAGRPLGDMVVALAREAVAAGAAGVVASGEEVAILRKELGSEVLLVVPGTRPPGAGAHDQARVVTPAEAIGRGADYLVVGRAVTGAAEPLEAWRRFWSGVRGAVATGLALVCIATGARLAYSGERPDSSVAGRASSRGSAAAVSTRAELRLVGRVVTMLRPVEGAHVILPGLGILTETDSTGRFDAGAIASGSYEIRIFAVGFEPVIGWVQIEAGPPSDETWLLKPLHPDGSDGMAGGMAMMAAQTGRGATQTGRSGLPPPADLPQSRWTRFPTPPDSGLGADPDPIAPALGLYLSHAERTRWTDPGLRGTPQANLAEILGSIIFADSLTSADRSGAPGPASWRLWAERLSLLERESSLAPGAPLIRRVIAYAGTRWALGMGRTRSGYAAARNARDAIARAARDQVPAADALGVTACFAALRSELDRMFPPGSEPPARAAAKKTTKRGARKSRRAS